MEESVERCLEMGFAKRYGGGDVDEGEQLVEGVDGLRGAYTCFKDGEPTGTKDVVKNMIGEGTGKVVWEHLLDVFKKVKRDVKV